MTAKKAKTCQICKTFFKARKDAKTCSAACRKRLERGLKAQAAAKAARLESALGREFHRIAAVLMANYVAHEPLFLVDERGEVPVSVIVPTPKAPSVSNESVEPVAQSTTLSEVVPVPSQAENVITTESLEPSSLTPGETLESADRDELPAPPIRRRFVSFHYNKLAFMITSLALVIVAAVGSSGMYLAARHNARSDKSTQVSDAYNVTNPSLNGVKASQQLQLGEANQLTINGQLQVNNVLALSPMAAPTVPTEGQVYFDQTAKAPAYYDGTQFISLAPQQHISSIGGSSGVIGLGNGLSVVNNQLNVSGSLAQQINNAANSGILSLSGTANQINVSGSTGNITLSLPQNIGKTSTPTFAGLNLASALPVNEGGTGTTSFTANAVLFGNGSGALQASNVGTAGDCLIVDGSGTPTFQSCSNGGLIVSGTSQTPGYLTKFDTTNNQITDSLVSESGSTVTVHGNLSVPGSSNLFTTDITNSFVGIGTAGPGYRLDVQGGDINTSGIYRVNGSQISSANLSNDTNLAKINGPNIFTAANTFSSTVAIQGTDSLTLGSGSNLGSIIFRDGASANTGRLELEGTLTGNVTFDLPVATGTQTICTIQSGNCAGSGSGITGSGTINKLAKFTDGQEIGDSSITDDGTTVTVAASQVIQGAAGLTITGASGLNGRLVLKNTSNSNALTLQSGVTTGNLTLTLPTGDGANGDCLKTNGSGVLSFTGCTGTGAGGGVTSINALTGPLNLEGTLNQINVSSSGDTITLSLPQDISTDGNATFRTITLTGADVADNLIVANALSGATGNLLDLKVNNFSKLTVDASGNINTAGQFQVNGSQISSTDLSNNANLAKLDGTGPQVFTGNNKFTGTILNQLDSSTAFQIQNSAGTSNLLVADTTISRLGVGTAAPGYTLDVNGDVNTSGVYRVNGITVCSASGCSAGAGSGNYIQNTTSLQATANFYIQSASSSSVGGIIRGASGSQTADLFQLRDSSGTLLDNFTATGALGVGGPAANGLLTIGTNATTTASGGLYFGTDTNLYRSGSAALATSGILQLQGATGTTGALNLATGTSDSSGIAFGTDTTLYRSAASILTTNSSLQLQGATGTTGALNLASGTTASSGIAFGTDTALYRSAAGTLNMQASSSGTATLQTAANSGTDVNGYNLNLAGGTGTGTGVGGNLNLQIAPSGSVPSLTWMTGATNDQYVAVDSSFIYWTNTSGNIGRANVNDGSSINTTFITGGSSPQGIAVDATATYIYWTNSSANTIGRAQLNGAGAATNVNQSFITGASTPRGITVDSTSNYIYWTNSNGKIGRAQLNGSGAATNVNQSFSNIGGIPYSVAIDSNYIYWANFASSGSGTTIGRANLSDGLGINANFITGASGPTGVAVDSSGHIYWANSTNGINTIGRAQLNGAGAATNIVQNFVTTTGVSPTSRPQGITVSSSYLYWTYVSGSNIGRLQLGGTTPGTPTTVASLSGVNGAALFQNTADSTTAFQIQNALGTSNLFVADTTNTRIGIGTTAPGNLLSVGALTTAVSTAQLAVSTGSAANIGLVVQGVASQSGSLLQLQDSNGNVNASFNSTGAQLTLGRVASSGTVTQGKLLLADGTTDNFSGTLQTTTLTANRTYTLPDSTGTFCLNTQNCSGAGTGYILNGTTTQTANFNIQSAATGSVGAIVQGANGQTADLLQLKSFGGSLLDNFTATGALGVGGPAANGLLTVGTNTTTASGGLYFGTDTNLYRSGSAALTTNGILQLQGATGTTGALNLATGTTASSGIAFGTDTNLYRSADGTLNIQGTSSVTLQTAAVSGADINGNDFNLSGGSGTGAGNGGNLNFQIAPPTSAVNQTFISGASSPRGVLVFGGYIYWANSNKTIGRALISTPGSPTQNFISGLAQAPEGIATDGTYIYWADGSTSIGRAPISNPASVNNSFITGVGAGVQGLAIDSTGTYIYWGNYSGGTIGRALISTPGSPNNNFVNIGSGSHGIAVDSTRIYWARSNMIGYALISTPGTTNTLVNSSYVSNGTGIAVDSTHVYWGNNGTDSIGRDSISGGSPDQYFITGATNPWDLAYDSTHLFWANNGSNNSIGSRTLNSTISNGLATVASLSGVNGSALFKNYTNTITAFQIQNSSGNNYLQVDTYSANIYLGTAIANTIQIGNTTGATGLTERVGTGNYSLDGVAGSTYAFGTSTTTGTITIGGTAQTGNITLGSSSGTNSVLIGDGAGATTVNISNSNTGGAVNIGSAFTTGTISIGGTGAQTGTINLGTGTGAQSINLATGGTGAKTVRLGSTASTSSTTIRSGTGNLSLQTQGTGILGVGNNAVAQNIAIGNATGATTVSVDCGTGNCSFGTTSTDHTTTVGSTNGISSTTIQAGSGGINLNNATIATNATTLALFNTTPTTINFGGAASTLNIGPTGATATSINLAGGSGATGCTVDGTTGNLTCSGDISTTATTGNQGWWSRSGATLQPVTAGDAITTSGNISTTGTGTITSAGLLTGSTGATISGAAINLNDSSNFATNINTGTSTGAISIGNSLAGAIALQGASTIGLTSGTTLNLTSTGANNINLTPGGGSNTGVLVKPTSDSTAAFRIQNAAGSLNFFNVDTTNETIGIGGATAAATLKVTSSTTGQVGFIVNKTAGTNDILQLQKSGTSVATVSDTGEVLFQNSSDSTTAFQVQNTSSSNLLRVDTSNGLVDITAPNSNPGSSSGVAKLTITSNWTDGSGDESQLLFGEGASSGLSSGKLYYTGVNNTVHLGALSGTGATADVLNYDRDGGSVVLQNSVDGNLTIQNNYASGSIILKPGTGADSTTALQIQNAAGTVTLFNADTTNSVIKIAGTTTTFATLTIDNAHFKSSQTTAPTIGTPSSCGTSPSAAVTAGSTDSAGSFTITSGSGSPTSTCQVDITFNKAYGAAPKSIMLTGASTVAALETPAVTAISTTNFTVLMPVNDTVSTDYKFYYWVVE